jgi:hypothetical protein
MWQAWCVTRCESGWCRRKVSSRLSVLSPKYEVLCCDQNGPPARREEGAYLDRYVTDEQRSRRPIFIATLRAGASWLFFRVARSTRMTKIWVLRSRLEKQPTGRQQSTSYFGDRTLVREAQLRFFPWRLRFYLIGIWWPMAQTGLRYERLPNAPFECQRRFFKPCSEFSDLKFGARAEGAPLLSAAA